MFVPQMKARKAIFSLSRYVCIQNCPIHRPCRDIAQGGTGISFDIFFPVAWIGIQSVVPIKTLPFQMVTLLPRQQRADPTAAYCCKELSPFHGKNALHATEFPLPSTEPLPIW